MEKVEIIAEAGVNHNGDYELAVALCDAAQKAGADYVKFQTWLADDLATQTAQKAEYQQVNDGSTNTQYEMLKPLELPREWHFKLKDYCEQIGIGFLSSSFGLEDTRFLVNQLGVGCIKIGSGEVTNIPLLEETARLATRIILSTGMCEMDEVALAVERIRQTNSDIELSLLQCTSQYPCPAEFINLRAMHSLAQAFACPVGFSDHSQSLTLGAVSVGAGATIIEKHLTLDCKMKGPDHKASLEPDDFTAYVRHIREAEQAMGDGVKRVMPPEVETKKIVQKVVVAACDIAAGSTLERIHLTTMRTGTPGIAPKDLSALVGSTVSRDYQKFAVIDG